ncbi:tol-pal system-associated acyl-CoA thioesterase [Solimonas sp. SE-A11]|uniref:tol-pal system-associated acyl-CoA thioesterase n=1 Tax=Solimonas sp. SE-A11 TaxID=3054954 RepID=UPI00259D252A|nr:tol-pal system-associated acyl-CoA thioesterase [Solimonas sp. SE-A11]MDM4771721.1 tol-pal system-associated acyl-CoA thioesterase [Solimonas sp. SE-A11]
MSEYRWPIRVYYEDTDASGVVYHANYLRWFERARTEWLREKGYGQERLRLEAGVAFTISTIEIGYLKPARLDDELQVQTRVVELRRASLIFEQSLLRDDGQVLTTARVRIACVDAATFRPKALPSGLF